MTLQVGDVAPSFTLKSTELKDVSLSDFKDHKVVLLFFPMAFTGVCTDELCQMRDNYSIYEKLNAQIVAISVDSPFTLKKFKEENNLNFPVLSDFNKSVSQAYGAFYEEFVLGLKGVSKRSAFLIDENGKIQYQEILENAGNLPNFEALEQVLSQ
ncbi:MAG: peroxiredoxin [Saprospiraceae bacterium]|jgi:peroxiredoxin|nr:peroxiredoxin [Chitinophagia bacterium]